MEQQNKTIKGSIGIAILFTVGLLILLYPAISQKWNARREKKLAVNVQKVVAKLPDTAKNENFEKAYVYNESLVGGVVPDVFAIREGEKDKTYEELLNPSGKGIMGSIQIPAIRVEIPIYHYTTEEVLQEGCGHIFGSSLPVGGESTHAVLSAHRGLPSARLFTDLDLIKKKDHFYIQVLGDTLAYEVDHIEVVEPDDTRSLAIKKGKDYVTLVTCTPYGVNTKRLLVRGHRVPFDPKVAKKELPKLPVTGPRLVVRILCVFIGLLLATAIRIVIDKIQKKKHENENNEDNTGNDQIDE